MDQTVQHGLSLYTVQICMYVRMGVCMCACRLKL